MTEDEARDWLRERFGVSREAIVGGYIDRLRSEAERQNLISAATIPSLWARHIVDSAQLIAHAPDDGGHWVDVGSGAGLPGLVIACLTDRPVTLIEPRKLRVAFLTETTEALGLRNVTIVQAKSATARLSAPASVISARAVAPLADLLADTIHFATPDTLWVLPKGRSAASEVASVRATWQGVFHVEPSLTDAEAGIVVARGVRRR